MKLAKLPHDPGALIDFFQEGLETLGAVCERSWHDRLQLVTEGAAARLWNDDGRLIETEIHFPPGDDSAPRNAQTEVFPGCPLTFHLTETLHASPVPLQRVCLQPFDNGKPLAADVAEKLWHAQFPGCTRWKLVKPFVAGWHFSLLLLVRCEIQAIDQHWSLRRLAISLPDGQPDEALASALDFCQPAEGGAIGWPTPDMANWQRLILSAIDIELSEDLASIRARQENYLHRELERIDAYFQSYERELRQRGQRQRGNDAKTKIDDRLASAGIEHQRRRKDQVQRHEIRVIPHLDALLLLAEPAWDATVAFVRKNQQETLPAQLIPRARRWVPLPETQGNSTR